MSPRANLDRETVVQAAAEIADREGLPGLTMAALAKQLGVRTPSLYNHVDGLPGLHRALALRAGREINAHLARAAVGVAGAGAVKAVAAAFRAYILEHPGLYAAAVPSTYPGEGEDAELEAINRETLEIVLAALAQFRLGEKEALHAVRGLRSLAHGFATLELAGGFGMPLDTDESFDYLVQRLIDGFERRAAD